MAPAPRRALWVRALVTGGSAGIGEAFARALATERTALALVARRLDPLERLAAELRARHDVEVEALAADLTDRTDLARVESRLEDRERPIDLLINNAGSETEHAAFVERQRDLLDAEVQINVLALLRLTHSAAAAMASRGSAGARARTVPRRIAVPTSRAQPPASAGRVPPRRYEGRG